MIGSVTVKDVARKADVSVGTVSRVFNNHSNVSEEIRDRVLKAASELGYERLVSSEPPRSGLVLLRRSAFSMAIWRIGVRQPVIPSGHIF
ncbi:hypothetical protein KDW_47040 [Dictyobacter vulcani]|uniref:HTH lacI-type domain-containing protein n=1 Tax=Dictyobacter vulcani TaxID=2607529 RepID=A0A5J4KTN8_9CHLR|nr:LacI family DNA-binding transcriptional regulator [Dictyobacter vulcani]GER90542.1 hypothetical protein KDW_47040 [Dictyobacter vulcani]